MTRLLNDDLGPIRAVLVFFSEIIVSTAFHHHTFFVFRDPLLHKLEILYQASSAPKHWLRKGRYAKFHAAIRAGLKITDDKKMCEAVQLVLFAMSYPQFPDGTLTACEEPDFVLTNGNGTIGIEHTRLFVQRPGKASLKQQESLQEQIVGRAFEFYQKSHSPPLMISCSFNDNTDYQYRDINTLAQQLVAGLPASLAKQKKWTLFESHDAGPNWVQGMGLIQGRAPHSYEPPEGRWDVSHGGCAYCSESIIQTALNTKEKKLNRYRKQYPRCGEFWLLMVVEGFTASSFMSTPDSKHIFTSSFDRVFFFELTKDSATEVRCRH